MQRGWTSKPEKETVPESVTEELRSSGAPEIGFQAKLRHVAMVGHAAGVDPYDKAATAPSELVSFTGSFHGRTLGALVLTYKVPHSLQLCSAIDQSLA